MKLTHLAIIPDGNRRWARAKGLPTFEGHRRGYENFKTIVRAAFAREISQVSFWVFSTENWKRSEEEVGYLMDLLLRALTKDVEEFHKENIRLRVIGRREGLSEKMLQAIATAEERTNKNTGGQVNILFNYGGRAEIVDAVKEIVASGASASEITEEVIDRHVWMHGIPAPEMIVRTSGEQRLSGFMSWAGAYSELMFIEKHWPNFTQEDLDLVIKEYTRRDRRFGT